MKNKLLICCFLLGLSTCLSAQHDREEIQQKIEAHRIAFLTEHLELTPEEAQNFWPVFNKFKADEKALKKEFKKPKAIDEMTDTEVENLLAAHLTKAEKELALKKQHFQELKQVLPARKIAKLIEAERIFKRKMLHKIKQKRRKEMGRN